MCLRFDILSGCRPAAWREFTDQMHPSIFTVFLLAVMETLKIRLRHQKSSSSKFLLGLSPTSPSQINLMPHVTRTKCTLMQSWCILMHLDASWCILMLLTASTLIGHYSYSSVIVSSYSSTVSIALPRMMLRILPRLMLRIPLVVAITEESIIAKCYRGNAWGVPGEYGVHAFNVHFLIL